MSNLISCTAWVARGIAARNPAKYDLDEKELERISAIARIELEDARVELVRAHEAAKSMGKGSEADEADETGSNDDDDEENWEDEPTGDDGDVPMEIDGNEQEPKKSDLAPYNLDTYDEDGGPTSLGPFSNIKGLQYYQSNDDDPHITLKEDDEDDEREALEILPTDNLIVAAKTEDDVSQLEIYLYDESQENLYVHHDLMLPSFPLCLEWLDYKPSSSVDSAPLGNYIAVGTFEPEIEIWSLDMTEAMYPDAVLGRPDKTAAHVPTPLGTGKKKKKKTKARTVSSEHHVDAVLGLSWNRSHRNLLASASADKTVKLWDLSRDPTAAAIRSFDVHKDKVQAIQWNKAEATVLLTGSYDRTVRVFDSRSPSSGVGASLGADVEALRWDPWDDHSFFVSLENGLVLSFDARTLPSNLSDPTPAKFTLSAHDGAVSGLDINPHIRGCIATGGTDKMVKVWNIIEDDGQRNLSMVTSRDLGVGKVFSVTFSPDDPLTLAAAGSKGKLQVWDVGSNLGARKAFGPKLARENHTLREKGNGGVIGLVDDHEDESGDDGD